MSKSIAYTDGSFQRVKTEDGRYVPLCGGGIYLTADTLGKPIEHKVSNINKESVQYRNIAGELEAAKTAIKLALLAKCDTIDIYHDLEGTANWALKKWKCKNPLTKDYVAFINAASTKIKINFHWVKGHNENEGNEKADNLADEAVKEAFNVLKVKGEIDSWIKYFQASCPALLIPGK